MEWTVKRSEMTPFIQAPFLPWQCTKHTDEQTEGTKGGHEKWTFKLQHSLKRLCRGLWNRFYVMMWRACRLVLLVNCRWLRFISPYYTPNDLNASESWNWKIFQLLQNFLWIVKNYIDYQCTTKRNITLVDNVVTGYAKMVIGFFYLYVFQTPRLLKQIWKS